MYYFNYVIIIDLNTTWANTVPYRIRIHALISNYISLCKFQIHVAYFIRHSSIHYNVCVCILYMYYGILANHKNLIAFCIKYFSYLFQQFF